MKYATKSYLAFVSLALFFIVFLAGYSTSYFQVFKGSFLDNAMLAARAVYSQLTAYTNPYASNRWINGPDAQSGVIKHDPSKASQGLTLYTSGDDTKAMLIDMEGNEIWRWALPFREVWPTADHLENVAKEGFLFWRKAVLYPNGDLLAIYDGAGVTPSGHGLAKIDKNSKLIWKFSDSVHHDVQIGEEGNIYALTYSFQHETLKGLNWIDPPMLVDSVVVLDPDGNEINRINIVDAIYSSPWSRLLRTAMPNTLGDYFHANSVQPLSKEIAGAFDFAEPGQILVSLRELYAVVLLDPKTGKAVWGMRGPWLGQHDAELMENGHMLIFDNNGNMKGWAGITRVLELNPLTHEIVWEYTGSVDERFSSQIRGAQQRLPNGNTLITESSNARLFEVTSDHEIVWDFRNPDRGVKDSAQIPILMWGQRYDRDNLFFLP